MVFDEEGKMVKGISIALVLSKNLFVARQPLFLNLNIPLLLDNMIVEEGHDAGIIFAASIDVLQIIIIGKIGGFVAFIVDIVHGGVGFIEDSIHLDSLVVAKLVIIVEGAGSSEFIPGFGGVETSEI